jgi:transposase-like protein
MELKYFDGVITEQTITKRYRELVRKYNPDNAVSDDELQSFTEIMKEINAEHQEVLVLLKHKAFAPIATETKPKVKTNSQVNSFVNGVASFFHLTNEQKQELGQQSKNMINTLIDSLVQNNLKK